MVYALYVNVATGKSQTGRVKLNISASAREVHGLLNGVLFIDLKKAFDTTDHEIILRKLANYGVDRNALRLCASFLCNRSQKCTVNGALPSVSKSTCLVPQKSILGSLFFLIYINDLPICLDISCAKMFAAFSNNLQII